MENLQQRMADLLLVEDTEKVVKERAKTLQHVAGNIIVDFVLYPEEEAKDGLAYALAAFYELGLHDAK